MELSDERQRKDEQEMKLYGFSSTSIYMDYRETLDQKLKWLMIEISDAHRAKGYDTEKMKEIDASLLENYKKFWHLVEPQMKIVYEDLQKTLDISDNLKCKVYPKNDLVLESQLEDIEDKLYKQKYYLKCLQKVEENLNKQIHLEEKTEKAHKLLKKDFEHFKKRESIKEKLGETLLKEHTNDTSWPYNGSTTSEKSRNGQEQLKKIEVLLENNEVWTIDDKN